MGEFAARGGNGFELHASVMRDTERADANAAP